MKTKGTSNLKRQCITVINWYDVFPFDHGGKLAILGLYQALSAWCDINIISFYNSPIKGDNNELYHSCVELNQHLKIYPIVKPLALLEQEKVFNKKHKLEAINIFDDCIPAYRCLAEYSEIVDEVSEITRDSDIVISEHPYTFSLIESACQKKVKWYREQNVEYDYKNLFWANLESKQSLLNELFVIEKNCCEKCDAIFAISEGDSKRIQSLYGISGRKITNISAGYDTVRNNYISPSDRASSKNNSGLRALFISSYATPAVNALNDVLRTASKMPGISFIVAGSVCNAINDVEVPNNVEVLGLVTDSTKNALLKGCDLALHPVDSGTGLNIKMLEYFAFGLPVIASEFGTRGTTVRDGFDCIVVGDGDYAYGITRLLSMTLSERDEMTSNAFDLLKREHSWHSSALKMAYAIYGDSLPSEADDIQLRNLSDADTFQIPNKPLFIRGTGEWGKICLKYLRNRGRTPTAFVDRDEKKTGTSIDNVPVISEYELLSHKDNATIIVANHLYPEIISSLLDAGISRDDIVMALDGIRVFALSGKNGTVPYYIDLGRL